MGKRDTIPIEGKICRRVGVEPHSLLASPSLAFVALGSRTPGPSLRARDPGIRSGHSIHAVDLDI